MVDRPLRRLGRVLPLPLLVAGLAVAIDLDLPASRLHAADGPTASPSPEQVDFFESKVRPVLADACLKCHGATKQSSDLRLDSRSAMLSGGASGPVLVPGNPDASLLVQAVRYTHEDVKMPPKPRGKLSDSQVEALATWVKMGAPWPDARPITATASDPDPAARHWAFQPVKAVAPPSVAHADRVRTPIDAFILARLESTGIAPSPEADRRTLLRRWSFDLTGLPPTAAEVAAFEADSRPDAHERAVDRLLASPRYGERWARHWLDVARYSDTKGYVFQEERRYPYAYTYRDYVIRSFNDDKPYDTFLIEQIAADRLGPGHDPRALAALGYLTLGRRFLNVREDIVDDRIDVVSRGMLGLTVGCARCHDHKFDPIPMDDYYSLFGVFASTTEPADPPEIPASVPAALARDFHEKVASKQAALDAFAQKKEAAIRADLAQHIEGYLRTALEIGFDARSARLDERARANHVPSGRVRGVAFRWKAHVDATRGKADPVMAAWHAFAAIPPAEFSAKAPEVAKALTTTDANRPVNPVVAQSFAQTPPTTMGDVAARYGRLLAEAQAKSKGSPLPDPGWEALRQVIEANNGPLAVNSETLSRWLDRAERGEYNRLTSAVAAIKASHPGSPPRAMVLTDSPTPFQPRVLIRGNPGRPGKTVPRQFLKVASGPRERQPFKDGSGRLELARAIASPDNPLTARVFVNRVWLQHFGAGLVTTPSDFGLRSDPPSHPELLDWLADDFVRHGWSIKHLHRQILLSGTYRQQSLDRAEALARDPENRLLWKFNRRRLEFEPLRDAVLAVAGALDSTIGGRPVVLARPVLGPSHDLRLHRPAESRRRLSDVRLRQSRHVEPAPVRDDGAAAGALPHEQPVPHRPGPAAGEPRRYAGKHSRGTDRPPL
ncbi:MAG: PSD1 and planctomycete cytochrome C domain-containing protein [Isosphaeraceae bacterium]